MDKRPDLPFSLISCPLGIWKWNQTRRCGERRQIKKLFRSRYCPEWLTPRLKNGIFTLPNIMDLSITNNPLDIVDQVHTTYTLRLPYYMVSASIEIFSRSMQVKMVLYWTLVPEIILFVVSRMSRLENPSSRGCQKRSFADFVSCY